MPVITRYIGYNIYIWSNEQNPLEPVHVHVSHTPRGNADKFWVTEDGLIIPSDSNKELRRSEIAKIVSYLSDDVIQKKIIDKWLEQFGEMRFIE